MCLQLCILGSLIKNLIERLVDELADCLVAVRAFLYYKILCCCCKDGEDDIVAGEEYNKNLDASEWNENGDKNNHSVESLLESLKKYPWFHSVDRETAHRMVRAGGQGCFLVRPSGSGKHPIALTVWHQYRPFNIFIRIREDNFVALGSVKSHELVFPSVDSLIRYYHIEELILVSNKRKSGKTLLICSPVGRRIIEEV